MIDGNIVWINSVHYRVIYLFVYNTSLMGLSGMLLWWKCTLIQQQCVHKLTCFRFSFINNGHGNVNFD